MRRLGLYLNSAAGFRSGGSDQEPDIALLGALASRYGVNPIIIGYHPNYKGITERDLKRVRDGVLSELYFLIPANVSLVESLLPFHPEGLILVGGRWDGGATLPSCGEEVGEDISQIMSLLSSRPAEIWALLEPSASSAKPLARAGLQGAVLNTHRYSSADFPTETYQELERLQDAALAFSRFGMVIAAMGGLHLSNLPPLLKIPHIEEFLVDQALISTAIIAGLEKAIGMFFNTLNRTS